MLERIKKMIPPRRFAVPLLGLFVAIGAIGQRSQPVLSKQIARLQATSSTIALEKQIPSTYAWVEKKSDNSSESISKAARLRRVLNNSSSRSQWSKIPISPGKTYTWMQRNSSSDSESLSKKLESTRTTQAKISQNKASIKRGTLRKNFPSSDGVFLYGSSPRSGEFGQGYIIFENLGGTVLGGMYMNASEFNCFQGNLAKSGQIAMTVKGYAGDTSLSQVASTNRLPRTNEDELTNYPYSVQLKNYYQLNTIGNREQRILKTCKAHFQ